MPAQTLAGSAGISFGKIPCVKEAGSPSGEIEGMFCRSIDSVPVSQIGIWRTNIQKSTFLTQLYKFRLLETILLPSL